MWRHIRTALLFSLALTFNASVYAGAVVMGMNLEFIEPRFNDEGFDGGFGLHAGYEFKDHKDWHIGSIVEIFNGWNSQNDMQYAGEFLYSSKSLLATARPRDWPVTFRAGLVDADYTILETDFSQNFRHVSATGFAYGIAVSIGDNKYRLDLLDYKRIKVDGDSFDSFGISLMVFAH